MTPQQHHEAADALNDTAAIGTKRFCAPLRERYAQMTADDAYAIQQINTERRVQSGGRIVGRKIGLTSRSVQQQLGVNQPDFGTLFADMAYGDAESIPFARLHQPKVEAEIAFVLGRDLTAVQSGYADVIDAIDYALPAIEIVGSRIEGWDIKFVDTVADNASSSAFVLGSSPRKLSQFDLRLCGMVMTRAGEPVSIGAGAACLGNPLNAVVWLARTMAAVGTPLRAGDLVLSGALGPMVAVQPGDAFEARISGLGSVRAIFEQAESDTARVQS